MSVTATPLLTEPAAERDVDFFVERVRLADRLFVALLAVFAGRFVGCLRCLVAPYAPAELRKSPRVSSAITSEYAGAEIR